MHIPNGCLHLHLRHRLLNPNREKLSLLFSRSHRCRHRGISNGLRVLGHRVVRTGNFSAHPQYLRTSQYGVHRSGLCMHESRLLSVALRFIFALALTRPIQASPHFHIPCIEYQQVMFTLLTFMISSIYEHQIR